MKNMYINGIIDSLSNFIALSEYGPEFSKYSYKYVLNYFKRIGKNPTNELSTFIMVTFGETEDEENDIEYRLAVILSLYELLETLPKIVKIKLGSRNHLKELLSNVRNVLQKYMFEYSVVFNENGNFIEYKPVEEESIEENLSDIPKEIADPIKELLKPMKNENELIGLISKIYSEFEKIKKDDLKNLNLETLNKILLNHVLYNLQGLTSDMNINNSFAGEL